MEPDQTNHSQHVPADSHESNLSVSSQASSAPIPPSFSHPQDHVHPLRWIFIGSQGLRSGWSIVVFLLIFVIAGRAVSELLKRTHLVGPHGNLFTPTNAFISELGGVIALLIAASIMAWIERKRVLDYNLTGPRRVAHFAQGIVGGFAALSVLVGVMAWGGWIHFGAPAIRGSEIALYAATWGATFFLVGCMEEGTMRCYFLYTLTRGINFWWALGLIGAMCGFLLLNHKGNGAWGVYAMALLGVVPCLRLHLAKAPGGSFWYAAWVTSTAFGFGHTGNNGENWIGIFAAAAIGFVFCVSVRLTGSAWWAIGCHAAWDWGETYFYGTADSGYVAQGHLLTATPAGSALWSGGSDGPEGSILSIGIVLCLLIALIVIYGRRRTEIAAASAQEQLAG